MNGHGREHCFRREQLEEESSSANSSARVRCNARGRDPYLWHHEGQDDCCQVCRKILGGSGYKKQHSPAPAKQTAAPLRQRSSAPPASWCLLAGELGTVGVRRVKMRRVSCWRVHEAFWFTFHMPWACLLVNRERP